jgi:hypothetical protein
VSQVTLDGGDQARRFLQIVGSGNSPSPFSPV